MKEEEILKQDDAEIVEEKKEESLADLNTEGSVDSDSLSKEEAIEMLKEFAAANEEFIAEKTKLTGELEKSEAEKAKFKDNWYRTTAEFENFKKRNEFTRRNAYDDGIKDALLPILNVGDSVDRALSVELDEKTKNGVMLIKRQFVETLAAIKVEEIDPSDGVFDPTTAEAIATLPTEDKDLDGKIAQVYKKGYKLNGKILRYAQVVVYKHNG